MFNGRLPPRWSRCSLDLPFSMLTSAVHPTSPKHWGCTCLISFSLHLILPVFLTLEIPHSTSLYSLVCFQILSDLISSANLISMLFTTPPQVTNRNMLRIKKKKSKTQPALTGIPGAFPSASPPGIAWENAINFLQLRGCLFQPLYTILMDSCVSSLISQFGDRTITKDSNY